MKTLFKSATIVDSNSVHHLKKRDVLVENGKILKISDSISQSEGMEIIELDDLHISPGWFDSSVSFGEPGYEERETIDHGLQTAAYSGFTGVVLNTNTNPVADTKGIINFIKSKSYQNAVDLYPNGTLTVKSDGSDLAELFDMQSEGAISFYDYKKPISNANLLKIALQYCQNFDGLVQSFPMEKSVAFNGTVHESYHSTRLGLKGIPSFSEELQINRDISILEYTGGKLHIPTVSTKNSVELIRNAKKRGLNISCSVAIFNLVLTDEVLETFDSDYKLLPPLRTDEDVQALIEGLIDGTIDGVTSDHNPIDQEHKKLEFEHAAYGSIGLEACFGALNNLMGLEATIKALTNLKKIFGIEENKIEEGQNAAITLFKGKGGGGYSTGKCWAFVKNRIHSKSKNCALIGLDMMGEVYGIYNNNQLVLNPSVL